MGLISRLKRITIGKIEAFLDAIEKPEDVLPRLIEELEEKVRQAANGEAKALTAVKAAQRKLDEATGRANRMKKGAELALKAEDIDTARRAIAAQMDAEKDVAQWTVSLDTAEQACSGAREVRKRLASDLESLRARKDELIARARAARDQKKVAEMMGSMKEGQGILDVVARMEDKVVQDESEAQVMNEVNHILGDLDKYKLDELQRNDEVQRRLDELKKEME